MTLRQQIVADLTTAMKAKEADKTGVLRMVKAAIMNREKEAIGTELNDADTLKVLQSLVKQRKDSIEQYEAASRADLAENEKKELQFIEKYLPQSATNEEIEAAVQAAVTETGATSPKEMGAVMKAVNAKLQGRSVDNKIVSEMVKAKLS